MTLAMVSFGISKAAQAIKSAAPKCFKAGTLVACLDQAGKETLKPIEEIEVGDKVLAYDEETGEQGYKEVVRLFRNKTQEWHHVFVNGEEIVCTAEHPFYVDGKGFVPAKELKERDNLLLSDGSKVEIESLKTEHVEIPETTYNFEVKDFHTYYVSHSNVLVHNKCWEWGKGSFDSVEESLIKHAKKHNASLGLEPNDVSGYFEKAKKFADTVVQRGVKASKYVDGATSNIRRYKYLGKYIDMDKVNKIIVSFGFIT